MPSHRGGGHGVDRAGFRRVLRDRVFVVLYTAETQSVVGDQLARVALSVLVFSETGSAPATAATYAATLLPAIIGGLFLGRLGDRFSRRSVMIGCDVVRAACFAAMAVPGIPLPVVIGLVVIAVVFGPVFSAAEVSYLSAHLSPEDFRAANALRMIAIQGAQVGGFVFGGIAVALLSPRLTLLLDAVTFALSVVLIVSLARTGPPERREQLPAPAVTPTRTGTAAADGEPGVRSGSPWRDRSLMSLLALTLLIGFFVVPEGLAVPFGDGAGAATWQIGVLLASGALGGVTGAVVLIRFVPTALRLKLACWMAVACGVPLVLSGLDHSWPTAAVCWFASGVFAAYVVETNTVLVQAVPDERRAAFVGAAGALLLGVQGLGLVAFGAVAEWLSPGDAIAIAGAAGSLLAALLVVLPLRELALGRSPAAAARAVSASTSTGPRHARDAE